MLFVFVCVCITYLFVHSINIYMPGGARSAVIITQNHVPGTVLYAVESSQPWERGTALSPFHRWRTEAQIGLKTRPGAHNYLEAEPEFKPQ